MVAGIVKARFARAGIAFDGPNPWDVQVRNPGFYRRVWRDGSLGMGESYMEGWWDCPRVDELVAKLLRGGMPRFARTMRALLRTLPWRWLNLQSRRRARVVAERHYDLGNELFFAFLDPYRQYSCGYFDGTDDLDEAQRRKLALIVRKLHVQPTDRVLDIGCGWGGLARYAAETCGCAVTGVNISQEQLRAARASCAGLPVAFVDRDYRAITGTFDKIVSVGMFEHVGCRNYRAYFETVHRCLEEDGLFLLHTIGSNESGTGGSEPWTAKYIFPNGMLPSLAQIGKASEGLFVVEDVHNLGSHYDRTLRAWNARFQRAWPGLAPRYDACFKRMWEYYLLSCAGAFRARELQLWQILMTRAGSASPPPVCR